jgi:hypothetical protein
MLDDMRLAAKHLGPSLALFLLGFFLLPASADAGISGPQLLTFGDYGTDTEISTQYEGQGIVFKDEDGYYPEIRWDEAALTNPVLSGTYGFGSPISAEFVVPGTTTPASVENLSMDVGYINEPGSTQLVVDHASGGPTAFLADEYGFDHLVAGGGNISGFQLEAIGEEPAGFELDNLAYTIPPPPPPPAPPPPAPSCSKYAIFDSRGSGETKGQISKPGKEFLAGFKERLGSLHGGGGVSGTPNPYPAVGVFSWKHLSQDVNGLGALLGVSQIGAYKASEQEGERELRSYISREVDGACGGKTKIVLLGYSQGAQATGNVYQHLSDPQRRRIAAVVLWGDPLYNHTDDPADRDTRAFDGSLGTRGGFREGSKVFSYCNKHDPICQNGLNEAELAWYRLKEHSLYWKSKPPQAENDGREVASFLVNGR